LNVILQGTLASFLAGAMTAVGALPVLFGKKVSIKAQDTLLGFAAGVSLPARRNVVVPGWTNIAVGATPLAACKHRLLS
jgi:ZIP family zinc transporter